jgi:hypothetical protein
MKALDILDHLILGIEDLDLGISWIKEKTGVTPARGGSHPGAGTRNALISLANLQYLEIMSIDPAQSCLGPMAAFIKKQETPRLIAWAAATSDIRELGEKAAGAGLGFEGPVVGSRVRTDHSILQWKILRITDDRNGTIPFFIEWDTGSVHPSKDAPQGCGLSVFEIEHPHPEQVQTVLWKLGIEATVQYGSAPRLKATLSTPRGYVEL